MPDPSIHTVSLPPPTAPPADPGTLPLSADGPATTGGPPELADRYPLAAEIARGGMGVVYAAHDRDLDREVAVKVLRPDLRDRPALARRFVAEARITGQLQHPGVPAVHALGTLPDGSPFLAMKLIRGRTLADLLADRPDPSADLPRFLHAFEQIAQTLAAAHAHGVIHRDLKPQNVMVGPFDEVQVMDWGLAKVLASGGVEPRRPDEPPDPEIEPGCDLDSHTRAGSVLGTPAYMPPEQARGEIDRVGRRADVFALGAILCEVLTGRPAFVGETAVRLALAKAGDVRPALAALADSGADPELVTLATRCLAPDPADRPADAGEVARATAAHRAGVETRLRRAEVGRAAAEATAVEQRKRRRVQLALGLVVLTVAAAGTTAWVAYVHQENQTAVAAAARRARVAAEVAAALDETRERLAEAWKEEADPDRMAAGADLVVATLQDAERSAAVDPGRPLDPALTADLARTKEAVDDLTRHVTLVTAAEQVIQEHAERVNPRSGASVRAAQADSYQRMLAAVRAFGLDPADPARAAEVGRAVATDRLVGRLTTYLAELALWAPDDERAEPAAALREARRAAGGVYARWQAVADAGDAAGLERLAADPAVLALDPLLLNALGRELAAAGKPGARLDLLRRSVAKYPRFALAHHDLAEACLAVAPPLLLEALRHEAAAAALVPASPLFHTNLGFCYLLNNATDAALPCLRTATELDPKAVHAWLLLAEVLRGRKDWAGAAEACRRAIAANPGLSIAHHELGLVRAAEGDAAGATAAFRAAADRFDPTDAPARPHFCWSLTDQLFRAGRPVEAYRLVARSLAARPDWLTGPDRLRRLAAVVAGWCGTHPTPDGLPPAGRATARRQALGWLRAELADWTARRAADPGAAYVETADLLGRPELALVRHPIAVGLLPADERAGWRAFWAEVRALRDATAPEPAPPPRLVR